MDCLLEAQTYSCNMDLGEGFLIRHYSVKSGLTACIRANCVAMFGVETRLGISPCNAYMQRIIQSQPGYTRHSYLEFRQLTSQYSNSSLLLIFSLSPNLWRGNSHVRHQWKLASLQHEPETPKASYLPAASCATESRNSSIRSEHLSSTSGMV